MTAHLRLARRFLLKITPGLLISSPGLIYKDQWWVKAEGTPTVSFALSPTPVPGGAGLQFSGQF